jgi:uncharacterized protein (DUF1684 family)
LAGRVSRERPKFAADDLARQMIGVRSVLQALDERAPQDLGRGGLVLPVVAAALTGVALAGSPASAQLPPAGPASASEHARWRAEREAELRAEDGWLSVAGLFFLEPGANSFGSASTNAVVLPADASPARAGVFTLAGERVFFDVSDAAEATLAGRPVRRGELRPASAEPARPADELRLGRLTLLAHRSGSRLAIRLRDPDGPVRRTFTGTRWFEVDPTWRVTGTFEAFASPRSVRILNVLGDRIELRSPGMVHFTREGRSHSLLALTEGDRLWLVFTDTTAGRDTYEAARFLYAPMPAGGRVELDFNRAHNPPCAYNPFTTCPLPPRDNRLPTPVRAGERAYPDKWHPK